MRVVPGFVVLFADWFLSNHWLYKNNVFSSWARLDMVITKRRYGD